MSDRPSLNSSKLYLSTFLSSTSVILHHAPQKYAVDVFEHGERDRFDRFSQLHSDYPGLTKSFGEFIP